MYAGWMRSISQRASLGLLAASGSRVIQPLGKLASELKAVQVANLLPVAPLDRSRRLPPQEDPAHHLLRARAVSEGGLGTGKVRVRLGVKPGC